MNESNHPHVNDAISSMTPEGQALVRRVEQVEGVSIEIRSNDRTYEGQRIEHDEPSRVERIKRFLGFGTFNLINMEEKSQAEQRMAHAMMTRGKKAFRILPSAERPLTHYERSKK